jgi:hypothetical protein
MAVKSVASLNKMKSQLFYKEAEHPAQKVVQTALWYLRDIVGVSEESLMFCFDLDEKHNWPTAKREIVCQIEQKICCGTIDMKFLEPWRCLHNFKSEFYKVSSDYVWRAALQFLNDIRDMVHVYN